MATAAPLDSRRSAGAMTLTVQVLARVAAARDAVTLRLTLPGTQRAPAPYLPGQFITLAFRGDRAIYYRSYSLCGDGRLDAPWEITVKRHDRGVISTYLCQRVRPGALLQASLPQGSFTLPAAIRSDTPIVFVAGGSGITPIYGMLRALARLTPAQRPPVWLYYAYHHPEDAIYGRELAALDPQRQWLRQRHYISSRGDRLRPQQVLSSLKADNVDAPRADWYVCGPDTLKRALEADVRRRGVPVSRFHTEVYGSPRARSAGAAPAESAAAPARVRLAESGAILTTHPGETLLETLERHGYRPEFSCRAGACGTCRLRVLAGQVRNGDGGGLGPADRQSGYVLSCVAEPVGDVTLASAGMPLASPRRAGRAATAGAQAAPDWRASRAAATKSLRVGLVAGAIGLFATACGLTAFASSTGTVAAGSSTNTGSSATSNSTSSGSATSGSSSSNSSSGSSSIQTQPGQGSTNTSTGVS
jgi:ferredoxin-NADP reductase